MRSIEARPAAESAALPGPAGSAPPGASAALARLLQRLSWPLLAWGLLLAFNFLFTPGFFEIEMRDGRLFGSMVDIFNRGTPVLLVSLGMTLVIATGGIDLSVGAVMAIAGAVAASLIARPEGSPLAFLDVQGSMALMIGVSLLMALGLGLINGALITWLNIQPIVATLILMVAGRGLAQLLTEGQIITFTHAPFEFLGSGFLFGLPFPIHIALMLLLLTLGTTRLTALGLFIESVGDNRRASWIAGINAASVLFAVYAFSGVCAAIAGLIATADIKAADANNAGLYLELDAILAVAIGGTSLAGGRFTLLGTVIGAIVIQTLTTTVLTHGFDPAMTLVVKAAVVVAVCLLQSSRFRTGCVGWLARKRSDAC